jgi:hypothetical protein
VKWTRVDDVKDDFARRWRRGDLLRTAVSGGSGVPSRIVLKGPSASELSAHFADARTWSDEWRSFPLGRVEWADRRDRILGTQRFPAALYFDDPEVIVDWLGHRSDVTRFRVLAELAGHRRQSAFDWLLRRPFQALGLAAAWERLLDVADWIEANPRSGLYARQVDISGVHSKFIETHSAVLREWLGATVNGTIEAGLGFKEKPARLRFRLIDRNLALLPGTRCPDIALDAASFATLDLAVSDVFITENEINYLAFPERPGSIVLFGAGYGWSALAQAQWLQRCRLHYWGDIDTHGFTILDRLRAKFAHVESFLMDRRTLMDHSASWGVEDVPSTSRLVHLDAEESALYDDLRSCRIVSPADGSSVGQVRLEQERIGYGYVSRALALLR